MFISSTMVVVVDLNALGGIVKHDQSHPAFQRVRPLAHAPPQLLSLGAASMPPCTSLTDATEGPERGRLPGSHLAFAILGPFD